MRTKKLTVLSFVVLLSLLTSLVFPTGVLADDSTPPSTEVPGVVTPPEETPTPEPTADAAAPEIVSTQEVIATEVSVSDAATPEPTVDAGSTAGDIATPEPAVDEGSTPSDVSLLSQLPENTELVVSNADGVVVPLGSQEAADIIAIQDPVWCPAGQAPTPGANNCTASYTSLAALIAATTNGVNRANGTIWIQSGTDLSASAVIINGSNYNTWDNFTLTLMGGWNGVSGSSTINGVSTFNVPLSIINWRNTITVNNITFNNINSTDSFTVGTSGNINLNNVVVNNQAGSNGNRYNTADLTTSNGNIVVQNSLFDGNNTTSENRGFSATTGNNGSITISDTTFQDAIRNSGGTNYDGATLSARTITLTNVTAQNNDGNGIVIDNNPNSVTVNNSSFLNNGEWGFNTDMENNPLTFNNTSFSGNTSGAYNYNGSRLTTSCTAPKVWIPGVGCLLDTIPPTISAAVTAGPNPNGWYRSNVTVHFTCADPGGSGIAACPADQILSAEGASVSSTAQTVTDNAGNVSAQSNVITVKIDKTLPTIVAAANPAPAAGWNNTTPVTVHFTCADTGGSGVATCPADQIFNASGTSTAQRVTDLAGNQSNFSNVISVNIDKAIPTISAAVTTGPNGSNGWYRSNATVRFTCADNAGGSGVVTCPADQILSTDGASISSTAQTVTDRAGNVSAQSNTVTVKIDKTPPTITAAATTSPTAAGWYNANVTIHFICTDETSGIVSCPADQVLTASGTSTAQTVTDNAGNVSGASNTVAVKIDKTIPTISAAITAGTPGTNGWYKSDVTVHFTCTDGGSGIASCPADQVLSTEGASVSSIAQNAIDNAGNVSAASNVITVKIDKTLPTIVAARTPAPTAAGWNNTNVTIHFTCTDGTSGIVSCPADQLLTASGTSTAQTTTDNAGNVSAASNVITVQIDKTAPSASASATPAPNANGWNNTDVTVNFIGTDVGSGIASCIAPVTLSTEGPGQSASGTCMDNAGNVSNIASANNINIDKTEPVIAVPANITDEATSASGATVNYTVTVKDNLDGGITVSCTPVSGSTFAIATTTVSCNSTDQAGNATSSTFTVTVQDVTSPIVTVPSNITMEATSSSGATFNFTASAADIVDGPLTPTCSPISGSVFALGTTTVSCSATDFAKNTSTSTFTVTVQDTTPPAIKSHADINIDTKKASGGIVSYNTPSTSDAVDGAGTSNCQPSSGSVFPVGDTTVTCRAIDRHGNSSESTFVIHVERIKKVSIDTQTGFVPVTGVPAALSCAKPSTTLRMAGFEVTFTSLCGYSAVLTESPEDSLSGALPAGSKYVSGIDIALMLNGNVINKLLAGTTSTLSFQVPYVTTGESLVILYWDSAASAWVEKSVTLVDGKVTLAVDKPGTYVLVDKSITTSMKDNSPVVTTLNGLYLAVMDFFQ